MIQYNSGPVLEVLDNRIALNTCALDQLQAKTDDRLSINYWNVDEEETFPIIGKAEMFTDKKDGNKLTKNHTISYRGEQRTILLEYGSIFLLTKFKDGIFKLESVDKDYLDLLDQIKDIQNDSI